MIKGFGDEFVVYKFSSIPFMIFNNNGKSQFCSTKNLDKRFAASACSFILENKII